MRELEIVITKARTNRRFNKIAKAISTLLVSAVVTVLLALLVTSLLVGSFGVSPQASIESLARGAFGSPSSIGNTLNKATPLLLVALSFIIARRAGRINIGGEGQIYLGALFAAVVGLATGFLPFPIPVILALLGSALGGALWGALAGFLRARRQVNEVISTLLLNFVAIFLISLIVHETWLLREPISSLNSLPQSPRLADTTFLPRLPIPGIERFHLGFVIAIFLAIGVYFLLTRTVLGFQFHAIGSNPLAALRAGMNVDRLTILALSVSGGLSGVAGGILVLGEQFRLRENLSAGYGFDGIVVALLATNQPLGSIVMAILFGALRAGGGFLEVRERVPASVIQITQGLALLLIAAFAHWLSRSERAEAST